MDLTETVVPKSDQLNADDLMSGPRTVTVVEVRKGNAEQPVDIVTDEYGPRRPYKPSKSMRRVMIMAWGPKTDVYVGRRMTIYRDPEVKFGGEKVGGIKISHLSDLKDGKALTVALTVTRGKRAPFRVQPLAGAPAAPGLSDRIDKAINAFRDVGVTVEQLGERLGKPVGKWTEADVTSLLAYYQELQQPKQEAD
ncbi:hypothetical protein [Luteipulveratus mongoliensis]|uniref:hypothetical protein n=1 Tax=Luteipulveratus mongoliensis TaxID=571913 RepID=UPI000697476D|nr:hypothetical protein [Luteipulveratus mongoliensis]